MPVVHVNNIDMYYEIHGDGEPLVFIPGWGTEITTIMEQIDGLARENRVIAIDNRGVGRSTKPDTAWSIETMADDTVGVMDALGIRRAHILGVSMGSMVAQVIAAKYPDRVNGLVLHVGYTRIPFLVKTLVNVMKYLPGSKKKSEEIMAIIFGQNYPPTPESFRLQGEAATTFDGRKYLGRIRAPTLIVNGTRDPIVPVTISKELAGGIAGARLILADGDHFFGVTHLEWLLEPVREFLNEVDKQMTGTR